jgi:ribonuclease HI
MIAVTPPHFLLLTQAQSKRAPSLPAGAGGLWRFVLEEIEGTQRIEAAEIEPGVWGERLQLLAVVRGLEALEQPSKVTLITRSRFVGNGIRVNLNAWRENHWQWEHFGEMIPIKNVDLWQRVDQALKYHTLDCRIWDFEIPKSAAAPRTDSQRGQMPALRNKIMLKRSGRASLLVRSQPSTQASDIRIKPLGRGRAFGYCPASASKAAAFTG